jgi:hypothetical protein
MSAFEEVGALVGAAAGGAPPAAAEALAEIRARLDGPLRIAVAGRVKSGKSTLLNALVGERLAPTDAGECTRLVAWFHEGIGYDVTAIRRDGSRTPLVFSRGDGALEIDLGDLRLEDVDRLDVGWPSSILRDVTLIDTPGLASIHDEHSVRTREFLAFGEDRPSDADAVIYLMRHLHRRDVDFLEAFFDRSVVGSSPANAIGVLSRADEVGSGRLDAMESAGRVAARYRADPTMRSLCATVLPVAGLLAETGLTLRESEAAALRALATTPAKVLARMLLSADDFVVVDRSPLTVEARSELLGRLGMFGVRMVVREVQAGRATAATEISRLLVEVSGLDALWGTIRTTFVPRARILKARTAIAALRAVSRAEGASDPVWAARLQAEAERIESAAFEFAELRLQHLVLSETVRLSPDEQAEVARVTGNTDFSARLGISADASASERQAAALVAIQRWRSRAADPFADSALVEAADTMARAYEAAYASATVTR